MFAFADFDIYHMDPLLSVAKCLGVSRLMDVGVRFLDLWKRKHESRKWLETEPEASKSDYLIINAELVEEMEVCERCVDSIPH